MTRRLTPNWFGVKTATPQMEMPKRPCPIIDYITHSLLMYIIFNIHNDHNDSLNETRSKKTIRNYYA